jgi:hypothetical protein
LDSFSFAKLSTDQLVAVLDILDSRDRVVGLHGAAGTGKTDVLRALQAGIRADGKDTFAIAPTASAVEALRARGFQDAVTVDRFLLDASYREGVQGKVAFVDEAGMIGTGKLLSVLKATEDIGSRAVLIGDTNQLKSVDAGDALRILHKDSELKTFNLYQVFRQAGLYREAIKALREDPVLGFHRLEMLHAVEEVPSETLPFHAADHYVDLMKQPNQNDVKRSILAVCPTWDDIQKLTSAIRGRLFSEGRLGRSVEMNRLQALSWTDAQKHNLANYKIGMVLVFHRDVKDAKKNEMLVVKGVVDGKLIASPKEGQYVRLNSRHTNAFSVYDRESIKIAPGDRVLLQANRNGKNGSFKATNGEIVTVQGISDKHEMVLDDGRVVPANYQQFAHGYAVTVHGAQGKTVDSVIVAGEKMSREHFYVAASRGRETVTVFTPDKYELQTSIMKSGERMSASELVAGQEKMESLAKANAQSHSIGAREGRGEALAR